MPALNACHSRVVLALEKAGWTVAAKPFTLASPVNNLFADIEAHRTVNGFEEEMIVVEAKCFQDSGNYMPDLYSAIGQYLIYQNLMQQLGLNSPLYLAIPSKVYYGIFEPLASSIVSKNEMKIIVVNLDAEVIERWLE
jgi:glucose-6-phosphate 1-dehydrogenase